MIRPAAIADADAIAGLIAGMGGHDDVGGVDVRRTLGAALGSPSWRALVADEDGEVVGYVEVQARPAVLRGPRQAWLAALVVAPGWQRKGLGGELLSVADREAALLGCAELVVESSTFRDCAHGFYRTAGFEECRPALRFRRDVEMPHDVTLEGRFVALAARAATAVEAAVAGLADAPPVGPGADGAPTEGADRAAEEAAAGILSQLGVPLVSEEAGLLGPRQVKGGEPWICIDPLDGSRNFRAGLAPMPPRSAWCSTGARSPASSWTCPPGGAVGPPGEGARGRTAGPPAPATGPSPSSPVPRRGRFCRRWTGTSGYGCRAARRSTCVGWPTDRPAPSSMSPVASSTCTIWPDRWPCCGRLEPPPSAPTAIWCSSPTPPAATAWRPPTTSGRRPACARPPARCWRQCQPLEASHARRRAGAALRRLRNVRPAFTWAPLGVTPTSYGLATMATMHLGEPREVGG